MVCGYFILPEPASYVFFYAIFNLRNLFYLIEQNELADMFIGIADGTKDETELRYWINDHIE